jgi:hypothetical protein
VSYAVRPLVQGYDELRLRIDRREAGSYRVHASTHSAEASTSFELPFNELEIENFILKVSRPRGRRRIDTSAIAHARRFGGGLFTALFAGEIYRLYDDAIAHARSAGRGVRITLCLSGSPELIDVPWEFLFDDPDFLAVSAFTPVVRYLDLPRAHRPLLVEPPLRLLGVVSSPAEYEQLDTERERHNLERALSGLTEAGAVELHWLERPTLAALLKALQTHTFHALHYIGHGVYDRDAERGVLLFEDDSGWARPVGGDTLGMILHDFSSLRLAVLNACEGARTARTDPFAGVAGSLVQRDIPAVVAMQFEISDDAAIVFAGGFYEQLAAGSPVDASLAAARLAMLAARSDDIEWGTPVLFMRVMDGRIFDLGDHPELSVPSTTPASTSDAAAGGRSDAAAGGRAAVATAHTVELVSARELAGPVDTAQHLPDTSRAQRPTGSATDPESAHRVPPAEADARPTLARRRVGRTLAAICAAVAGAGVAAAIASNDGSTAGLRAARGGPLTVNYRAPWRVASSDLPGGFAFRSTGGSQAAAPAAILLRSGSTTLTGGTLAKPALIPAGPPPQLVARYGRPVSDQPAQVAANPGERYAWDHNGQSLVAYVLATAGSDLAIVCAGPHSASSGLSACAGLATGARVSGVPLLPPGPDPKLRASLTSTLTPVARARTSLNGLGGQSMTRLSTLAGSVANSETTAASRLARLAVPARYHALITRLVSAMTREPAAFRALSAAARGNHRRAFLAARNLAVAASGAFASAANAFHGTGLRLPSLKPLSLGGPPAAAKPSRSTPASPTVTPRGPTYAPPSSRSPQTPSQTFTSPIA